MLFNVGLWSPRGSALEPGESPTARFAALNDAAAIHDALQGKPRLGDVQRAALQQALADAAPGAHIDNIAPQWFDTGHLQEAQAKIHAASSEQYELQPVVGRE